jgi:hypothetical protein
MYTFMSSEFRTPSRSVQKTLATADWARHNSRRKDPTLQSRQSPWSVIRVCPASSLLCQFSLP